MSLEPSQSLGSLLWIWQILVATDAGQLLIVSTVLTVIGLSWETWYRGFLLCSLTPRRLSDVEITHPHIPCFHNMGMVLGANIQLFLITVLYLPGILFHADPRAWVVLGALFLLSSTLGLAAELEWHGVPEHLFAFSTGTTAVVLLQLLLHTQTQTQPTQTIALFILLCISLLGSMFVLRHSRHRRALLTAGITFGVWLAVTSFR